MLKLLLKVEIEAKVAKINTYICITLFLILNFKVNFYVLLQFALLYNVNLIKTTM